MAEQQPCHHALALAQFHKDGALGHASHGFAPCSLHEIGLAQPVGNTGEVDAAQSVKVLRKKYGTKTPVFSCHGAVEGVGCDARFRRALVVANRPGVLMCSACTAHRRVPASHRGCVHLTNLGHGLRLAARPTSELPTSTASQVWQLHLAQ